MKHSLLRGRVQEPELNLVAPLNACPLPPRMQGNHPCTRYSSPHTRRLNRHRGSPVRLLMLQQPWQLRNVGGDAPRLVAGEEMRRRVLAPFPSQLVRFEICGGPFWFMVGRMGVASILRLQQSEHLAQLVAERLKCFLIGRAIVRCNCLLKAWKFDNQNPLL